MSNGRERAIKRIGLGAVVLVAVALVVRHLLASPAVVLLLPADGAEWVRADRPFDPLLQWDTGFRATFETTFTVPPGFGGATLSVTALKRVAVWVDGVRLFDGGVRDAADWKVPRAVAVPDTLAAGPHRLRLVVGHADGPPLVRAACGPLGIRTGRGDWRAGGGDHPVDRRAVPVSAPWRPSLPARYGPSAPAVVRCLPWLVVLFVAGAGTAWGWRGPAAGADWGRRLRWVVLGLWVAMGLADLYRIPLDRGYDAGPHYDYIRYVADHAGRLPPPEEGVQFFQGPLYYLVSAGLWRGLAAMGLSDRDLPYLMRLVPLACGAGLAELCYRTARHVCPGRTDLHAVAVVVGGLMPVNLYMGLAVSNEPLAAVLGAAVGLVGVRFRVHPGDADDARWWAAAGGLLGLAVLAKVSMVLWAVPLAVVMAVGRRPRVAVWSVAVMAAVAAAVCGWFFVRTWAVAGTPVLSHTVLQTGRWWQDPGYRTPGQFVPSGRGLTRVAYGGTDSVWDSIYSSLWANGFLSGVAADPHPPWHLDAMACGQWLALGPTAALLVGVVAARRRPGLGLCRLAVGLFVLALLWVYLTLPIYSCGKASYLLSTVPCLAVLTAAGFDRVMVGRRSRAAVAGLLTAWAAASWMTYVATG